MPRNGDGSSDNGPIEGHEILHGATGDASLQHTKHVAPMPEGEKGDSLPGLSGGGAAAPISSSSEQYSVNEPHTSTSVTSESKKRSEPHHASPDRSPNLEQKFTKLDKDEVDIATAQTGEQEARARERRVQDAVVQSGKDESEKRSGGGHADVEMMHGRATLEGDKSKQHESGQGDGGVAHDADMLQRKKAEKFGGVNLADDEENGGHNGMNGKMHAGYGAGQNVESHGAGQHGDQKSQEHDGSKGSSGQSHGARGAVDGQKDHGNMNGGTTAHSESDKQKSHGSSGGDAVVTDADILQRKKAEKFGGVNLGDD